MPRNQFLSHDVNDTPWKKQATKTVSVKCQTCILNCIAQWTGAGRGAAVPTRMALGSGQGPGPLEELWGKSWAPPTSNRPSLAPAMRTILSVFWRLVGLVPGDLGHLKCPRPWKNNCLSANRGAWPAGTFRACHQPRSVKLSPASGRVVIGFPRPANGITPPNELRGCNH